MSEDADQSPADEQSPEADRRTENDRREAERRKREEPVEAERRKGKERRVAPRRKRSMNQYDLEEDVMELIIAINKFKQQSGRAFPTWSEVLEIVKSLGYEKRS